MSDVITVSVAAFTKELFSIASVDECVPVGFAEEFNSMVTDYNSIVPVLEELQAKYEISNEIMGQLYETTMHYAYIDSYKMHLLNSKHDEILMAMYDSGTITKRDSVDVVLTQLMIALKQSEVVVRAPSEVKESAEDILMFGC